MIHFTLKPIGGTAGFVIYNIISYSACKGIKGDTFYEEVSSGFHVFSGTDSLYFTQNLPDAYAFIMGRLTAFEAERAKLS
ncbi:hypothetical protein THIX_60769 [Thiomonas sp. X19]|jgi:hypothetical protein|uniref:hypothetical protein n=1 Tax=Thiomonas sp. X19 TaxID=1050370 RepID=UPI000B72FF7C|nr:hypothetical protein [Thiomonas sp. X19]SCC93598.1 hypothetical protein THIX_30826 [Thiomonas sp. X19]SCC94711.1 hypothetical protein THIX_60769 [Thiomonas sp. X19]